MDNVVKFPKPLAYEDPTKDVDAAVRYLSENGFDDMIAFASKEGTGEIEIIQTCGTYMDALAYLRLAEAALIRTIERDALDV